jgi:carbohydrate esterase-like sialic acid-specific acetylesterase
MVGRGELSDLPPGFPANPTRLWNFSNAYRWEPAREPIDSPIGQLDFVSRDERAAVGPSLALADTFVSMHPATTVGLIPCAKGSSSINDWQKTDSTNQRSTLYGSCMTRMKMVSPANGTNSGCHFLARGRRCRNGEECTKVEGALCDFCGRSPS